MDATPPVTSPAGSPLSVPAWLLDRRDLSLAAKWIYAHLRSRPHGGVTVGQLVHASRNGRNSVQAALRQLVAARLIELRQVRSADGQLAGTYYAWLDPVAERSTN